MLSYSPQAPLVCALGSMYAYVYYVKINISPCLTNANNVNTVINILIKATPHRHTDTHVAQQRCANFRDDMNNYIRNGPSINVYVFTFEKIYV